MVKRTNEQNAARLMLEVKAEQRELWLECKAKAEAKLGFKLTNSQVFTIICGTYMNDGTFIKGGNV